ncbi:hypothetical protein ET475_13110 [Microbacterium protaetiae]|uniref:Transporter n=1 Tax=Microbacterium protaetiae TaxID=2509458 RepID=A0A4P6EF18_9MICO|nr:hypothetical protein [Microbacterium protaetiae]QAY60834.1 hypothetical protein ET475_13110 [Microbacterium protaetiae]
MVATVLRLRYRVLANTLSRNPWQLVGFVFGMLWAAGALLLLVIGLVALAIWQGPEQARVVAVLGGSLLVLGWVVGPVIIAGADTSVDAARLAPFPLTMRQLMLALAGTGLTGIPGIATTVAALAAMVLWVRRPAAAVVAVVCAAIGVLICVLASRLVTTLASGLGAGRRGRELVGTVVLALVILSGPIITGAMALLDAGDAPLQRLWQAAGILGWTPLGVAWAVPADVAAGAWLAAAVKLVIAVASIVLLWIAWGAALRASVSAPPRRSTRAAKAGALGLFGRMPTGGVGATWARSLTAWLRDPRYLRQLILVPLMPIVFAFTGGVGSTLFAASGAVVAFLVSIVGYTDVSYDGTAFATVLASGVRGRHDRLGRLLGAACVGVPAILVVAFVTVAVSGAWQLLPAVLGASVALMLSGYAVSAVSSALIVSPVAAPGDSPFKTVPGQTFVNGLLVFVVMAGVVVLAAPAVVLALIGAIAGQTLLAWLSLPVAVVVGVAAMIAGVVIGGRILDRTGPDLLQRIKAFPVG